MLVENSTATNAADKVGYESPSQFSREYARMFGAPPLRDIGGLAAPRGNRTFNKLQSGNNINLSQNLMDESDLCQSFGCFSRRYRHKPAQPDIVSNLSAYLSIYFGKANLPE